MTRLSDFVTWFHHETRAWTRKRLRKSRRFMYSLIVGDKGPERRFVITYWREYGSEDTRRSHFGFWRRMEKRCGFMSRWASPVMEFLELRRLRMAAIYTSCDI